MIRSKCKGDYPGNARITKHNLPEAPEELGVKNNDKTNDTYEQRRTITEEPPWNGQYCFEVLRPSQPSGVMSSAVSLPNLTFTGQA